MKHTPQYLFDKYGKRIFAEWDYSYDEENDEDVEYSEEELLSVIRELITLGADLNVVEADGDTPVHHFVYYFDILKMLVEEYGTDVKVLDNGNFVYESIIHDDRIDILRYLFERGINVNRRDCVGWSMLHHAVNWRKKDIVELLLDFGADPNAQCHSGTPLHRWLDDADIARLLLEHGADPNSRDWDNWTPLCLCRDVETARILLEFGANPNLDLGKGRTPLSCNTIHSDDLVRISRVCGYLGLERVHGDTRMNEGKRAEIDDRKCM